MAWLSLATRASTPAALVDTEVCRGCTNTTGGRRRQGWQTGMQQTRHCNHWAQVTVGLTVGLTIANTHLCVLQVNIELVHPPLRRFQLLLRLGACRRLLIRVLKTTEGGQTGGVGGQRERRHT